jgi:putative DNA primase/helicase
VINANSLTTDQWRRVFFELLNQPESLFNNQYQDCPLCSSAGDFKGREMDPGYHMVCNNCGGLDGKGGMITQLGFSERILGVDRNTAKYRIAQFLGLPQPQQQRSTTAPLRRSSAIEAASGRWPELLGALAGLTPEQLSDKHQPCPSCGGTDRYRWDRDDGTGGWFCNQCGGKDHRGGAGSGMDLLTRVTGWDYKQACSRVEQYLGIAPPPKPTAKPKRPHRVPTPPPAGTPPPALGSAVAQFPYGPDRANPWYWVQRVPMPPKGDRPQKLFVQRTWLDSKWHYPSKRDGFASHWPEPRPIYRLPDLNDRPGDPVLISEGEGKTDDATHLFPEHVCVSWTGGTAGIAHTDWEPLRGRSCTLWPDADDKGRACMAKLGVALLHLDCTVVVVNPPDDAEQGWDLADALAEGWTPQRAAKNLALFAKALNPLPKKPKPAPVPEPAPAAAAPPPVDLPSSAPFVCLGFDGDSYFYLPHSTGQVIRLSGSGHTSTNLLRLAQLSYWEVLYPSKTGVNWSSAASSLFSAQAHVGVFDADRIRGRGAWLDDGRTVFHLGDRLIVDSEPHSVLTPPPTRFFYEQARRLDGPSATLLSDEDAMRIQTIAERFRWELPASSHFLTGWMVLAPVCGALSWRPHIWVTGGAGTGKTTILKTFMRPLMGGVFQSATGGTTEAGLRGTLKSDAIPVVFDEFDQNEAKDKAIVQNILALARIASSEGGRIYKGTPTGGSTSFEIRSMFCVSSINVALIQKADIDRFCVLGLRKDPMDKSEWLDFEREILSVATIDNGRALIARTLCQLPVITQNARTLAQALGRRFGQRFGDQHGTLLAGAWSLEAGGGAVLTLEQADQWIASMNWDHQQHDAGDADELKCRDTILQQIVRFGGGLDASLGEMVDVVARHQALSGKLWNDLVPILGRYGLKVFRQAETLPDGDAAAGHCLAIANSNAQLDGLLRSTPWSGGAHRSSLRRIEGAVTPKAGTHFAGIGTKRCTVIPITTSEPAAA